MTRIQESANSEKYPVKSLWCMTWPSASLWWSQLQVVLYSVRCHRRDRMSHTKLQQKLQREHLVMCMLVMAYGIRCHVESMGSTGSCFVGYRGSEHVHGDVITSAMGSQNTITIVCSTVYSSADQSKHLSSASLAFVRGIHRWPVNSPHKGPVTQKMFPFDDVIMPRVNCASISSGHAYVSNLFPPQRSRNTEKKHKTYLAL